MSGSNALTITRDPTVLVNPLAAMDAGTQSAGLVYDLRQKQANEAAGQAYQGAINPQTGEFDPNEFRRRLAASGPAAMAAGTALMNTQNISSDQLKQSLEKQKWINSTAGALLLQGDYSDGAMLGALQKGVAGGILTLPEAQKQLADMPPDAAGRKRWLEVHRDTSGSYVEQTQTQYGTMGSEIDPTGRRVGTVQQSPRFGGGLSTQPQAGVPLGLNPAEATAIDKIDIGRGQTIQVPHGMVPDLLRANPAWRAIAAPGGSPTSSTTPPPPPANYVARPPPATPAAPAVPSAAAPGGPQIYHPGMGVLPGPGASLSSGGVNVASADPSFAPGVGVAAPPSPAVAGDVNAILAGMNQGRAAPQGGTQTAWNALQNGGVPVAAAPTAAAPARPAVVAPAATVSPTPSQPTLGISAPPGQVEAGQETGKQSATMGGALITRGDQAPVQKANLQNMLTDLAKLDSMGPGTEKEIFLNSVMQKISGYGFSMNRDQVAAGNSFAKLANIAVGQQLAAIGGTDARQNLFMGSNPNLDLSKLGNQRIIQMLMGNEDAIQAKARAWNAWAQSHGDDTYRQFQDDFNRHFDPRVFQSQYMAQGGPELAALRASLEREGTGAIEKFKADTKYARDNRWIQ